MPFALPDPDEPYPVLLPDGSRHTGTVQLRNVVSNPRMDIGAYTYASDFDPPEDWATRLAPYLFPFSHEKLTIGRFCQIAHGVRFITSSANHAMDGLTTYPFAIFDPDRIVGFQPDKRETIIGHDVWLGYGAMVMPGAQIGNGVIIGAGSVVRGHVPDFAIVTGNPGQIIRHRFDEKDRARLSELAWWNWPADHVAAAHAALEAHDIDALERAAP